MHYGVLATKNSIMKLQKGFAVQKFASKIAIQFSQHSYQIRMQMRWHLVDTDKTYIQ